MTRIPLTLRFSSWGSLALAGCVALTSVACSDDGELSLLEQQECNPLGGSGCITPWPSNIYAAEDVGSETGIRVDLPIGALPTNTDGRVIDPVEFNERWDGFSPAAPMLLAFPNGVEPSPLVHYSNYGDSLTDVSPTVIIDMSTGERVAHFAEIDVREPDRLDKQAMYMRPAARLKGGTRYVAAVRKSLKASDGTDLPISPGFQAILDGDITGHERLERVRASYDEIFAALESQGIPRSDLVVAWDFTTASDTRLRADLTDAREKVLAATGVDGAELDFDITVDEPDYGDDRFRKVEGTFVAPLMLNNDGEALFGTTLVRDAAGRPDITGYYDVPFTSIIPDCAQASSPVPVIVYGHGLFGAHDQADGTAQQNLADRMCAVVIGTDMRGMSEIDLPNIVLTLNDFNIANQVFDVLIQGIMNHVSMVQAIRGPMAERLFVDGEGDSLVDIDRIYYYGLSQGHIFGPTVAAYDPHISRAVLGVGGANYSMMLERSRDWPTYRNTLIGAYDDPLNIAIMINLLQMRWDTTEPVNVIADMPGSIFENAPDKQFLLHMAVGDDEVPNISTEYQARTMGIPVLGPAVYQPWGIDEVEDAPLSSALVIWDNGDGPIPFGNEAPADNSAHSLTRKVEASIEQMTEFYNTGNVVHTCGDGLVCDCTAGNCGEFL